MGARDREASESTDELQVGGTLTAAIGAPASEQSFAARLLGLQRTVGNAAVGRMLARQTAATTKPKASADRITVTERKYVVFFVGTGDLYGKQAHRFAEVAWKADHKLIDAGSLQDAIVRITADARSAQGPDTAVRISEIVLIAHGHPTGFIKMPIIPGRKGTTVAELIKLQEELGGGKHPQLAAARLQLLGLIDNGTTVIVRGCRVGRVQELADALTAFFGGYATVMLPKEYQAFSRLRIGGPEIKNEADAYDFLVSHGFVAYGSDYEVKDKRGLDPDDENAWKTRWVKENLRDGYVPEMFFVDDEHVDQFRHASDDDPAIQEFKEYEPGGTTPMVTDKWTVGQVKSDLDDDAALDPLTSDQIVQRASWYLSQLRMLEQNSPDDWRKIGEMAWWVLRCDRAWQRKADSSRISSGSADNDPLGGAQLTMPGLVYDTNLLAIEAVKRPDLRITHPDPFLTEELTPQGITPIEEAENIAVGDQQAAATAQAAAASGRQGGARGSGGPKPGGGGTGDPTQVTPDDPNKYPAPGPIDYPHVTLDPHQEPEEKKLPVSGIPRIPNFQHKIKIPVQASSPDALFSVRGVSVDLDGYVDWGVKGEREVAFGEIFKTEPGKPLFSGIKADAKLAEAKSGDWFLKWKAGGETTWSKADAENKWEVSIGAEGGYGPFSGEVKVFASFDATKGELRIGGVKVTPIRVTAQYPLKLNDGTTVTFTGRTSLTWDIQPEWVNIAKKVGLRVGGTAAETAGGVAAGDAIITGFGAITAAEAATLGVAGVAIIVLLVAYYKSVKDWQDIKGVQPVADRALNDLMSGFCSAWGVAGTGGDSGTALYAKGAEIGHLLSKRTAEHGVKVWEHEHHKTFPGSADDVDANWPQYFTEHPGADKQMRAYALGAFHDWVFGAFYREWRRQHKDDMMFEKNDYWARVYLMGSPEAVPPDQPDWWYTPRPEPQVVEDEF